MFTSKHVYVLGTNVKANVTSVAANIIFKKLDISGASH